MVTQAAPNSPTPEPAMVEEDNPCADGHCCCCEPGERCCDCGTIIAVPEPVEPDWINADTCVENMRIAFEDAICDQDGTPVDAVVNAGDLGVLIGLAGHAVSHRLAAIPTDRPAGGGAPTDAQVREAMQTAWDDFCDDAQAIPGDIYHEGRKTFFRAGTWADHTALHLRTALTRADQGSGETFADGEGDWIEWSGGECPVAPETMVEIKGRDGGIETDTAKSWGWDWMPTWPSSDIIAYRPVSA